MSMKQIEGKAKTLLRIFNGVKYLLALFFPALVNQITSVVSDEVNTLIFDPALLAICVLPLAAAPFLSVKWNKAFAFYSIVHYLISQFAIDYSFSYMSNKISAGANAGEVVLNMILPLGIIFLGLLFAYVSTTDSHFVGNFIVAFRAKDLERELDKAEKDLNSTEKRYFSKCLIKPSADELNKKRKTFKEKEEAYRKMLRERKLPISMDLFIMSLIVSVLLTILLTVSTCLIFAFSSDNTVLTFIRDNLMSKLVFIFIDVTIWVLSAKFAKTLGNL